MEIFADYYNYFRFAHYIFFVSWMAMLFYQPRLYVYHAENMDKPEFVKVVEVMEYKMYHYIGWIALIGSFATGALILLTMPSLLKSGYIHVKLTVVVLMAAYHLHLGYYMRALKEKRCTKDGMFFRAYNEVPTVAMIIIIWMIVFKPF
ncbi:protoporphyrinogen oxidase HemJ [Campylobacter sp. 9BO]|uniref:protoporphyrinogen oxidase HemJ n=1 Tax=Campylobacter sp. 9BO TaxID=3424759 RepID=UPI003D3536E8